MIRRPSHPAGGARDWVHPARVASRYQLSETENYQEWLTAPASDCGRLRRLLIRLEAGMLKRFPVSSAVNDPQNDTPQCIQDVPEFISAQAVFF